MPKPTTKQKILVERRLKRKYPQMYEKDWGKKKGKSNWAQRLKGKVKKLLGKRTTRTKVVEGELKKNLTKQEIAKFGGK